MNRSKLHALVWAEPISKIAARFGLSDRGLAKICARNHIPVPPRGYWAKVAANQYPVVSPLPRPDQDNEIALRSIYPTTATDAPGDDLVRMFGIQLAAPETTHPTKGRPPIASDNTATGKRRRVLPDPVALYAALEAESEKLMVAGMEFQKHRAAEAFLREVLCQVPHVDKYTADAILMWARAVGERLGKRDPLAATVQSIRLAASSQSKPSWWSIS